MGKCSKCGIVLHKDYMEQKEYEYFDNGIKISHWVWICRKCFKENE